LSILNYYFYLQFISLKIVSLQLFEDDIKQQL